MLFSKMNFNQLDNWIQHINAGEFDDLVSMYSEEALLFATFDEQPLDTPTLIQGYFRGFLAKEGSGVELDTSSVRHTELGKSTYLSTGLYTFFYKDGEEVISFHNEHDLIDKCRFYSSNEESRVKIAESGYKRAIAEHTWENRFNKLFDVLNDLYNIYS